MEKGVVRSAKALFDNPADGEKKVQVFEPLIDKRAAALLDEAKAAYALQAAQRRTSGGRAGDDRRGARGVDAADRMRQRQQFLRVQRRRRARRGRGGGPGGGGGGGGRGAAAAACRST